MKKLIAILFAMLMLCALSVSAFAVDETEIPVTIDNLDHSTDDTALVWEGTSVTANEVNLFTMKLPSAVTEGMTITVHIKGTSEGDFRSWLLNNTARADATASNQYKASDDGFVTGEFEKFMEFTFQDFDSVGAVDADQVAFKGPTYNTNLVNFKLDYIGIYNGPIADIEAGVVEELKPLADKAAAALASANNDPEAALAEAQAALDELEAKNTMGFPGVAELVKTAKDSVKEINTILKAGAEADAVAALQPSVDAVAAALADAKAAGEDVEKLEAALTAAKSAADEIAKAAEDTTYAAVKDAAKEAENSVKEVEKLIKTAKDAVAAAEAAAAKAAEEAAAKKKTTTLIVVIAVVAVAVIAVVIALIAKARKKK